MGLSHYRWGGAAVRTCFGNAANAGSATRHYAAVLALRSEPIGRLSRYQDVCLPLCVTQARAGGGAKDWLAGSGARHRLYILPRVLQFDACTPISNNHLSKQCGKVTPRLYHLAARLGSLRYSAVGIIIHKQSY